jgi:hypothetical protein
MKKVAFLFLVIDDVNFPKIWDFYFKNNQDKINIYIHPKNPENVRWHRECIIDDLKDTAWGHIVDAYKSLFMEASKNTDNVKFITISESCVPIKSFDFIYNMITQNDNESFVKLLPIKNYDWKCRITPEIIDVIGKSSIIKHYARMSLSRTHVIKLLSNKTKLNIFAKMQVGDEFFLSTIASTSTFNNLAITCDDWGFVEKQKIAIKNKIKKLYIEEETEKDVDNSNKIEKLRNKYDDIAKNPKTITKVSKEDLNNFRTTTSCFYRKFSLESDIEKYIYEFIR